MTEVLPMDRMEEDAPPAETAPEQQAPERARDESGRFAPKTEDAPQTQARGKPDETARARREAQERDEARRERDDFKGKYETLEKRFNDILNAAKGEEEKPAADPIADVKGTLEEIKQRFEKQDQAAETEQLWGQVRAFADQDEQQYVAKNPDFPQAAQHYIQSRIGELSALGYNQGEIEQQLKGEAEALLISAAQKGFSPAEALHNMAKARGFNGGVIQQSQRQAPQNFGGRSFGTAAGPAGGGVTAGQLSAMSEEDYIAFRSTPEGKRAIRIAQGG